MGPVVLWNVCFTDFWVGIAIYTAQCVAILVYSRLLVWGFDRKVRHDLLLLVEMAGLYAALWLLEYASRVLLIAITTAVAVFSLLIVVYLALGCKRELELINKPCNERNDSKRLLKECSECDAHKKRKTPPY